MENIDITPAEENNQKTDYKILKNWVNNDNITLLPDEVFEKLCHKSQQMIRGIQAFFSDRENFVAESVECADGKRREYLFLTSEVKDDIKKSKAEVLNHVEKCEKCKVACQESN